MSNFVVHPFFIAEGPSKDGAGRGCFQKFCSWKNRGRFGQGDEEMGFCGVVIKEGVDGALESGELDKIRLRVGGSEHVNGAGPCGGGVLQTGGEGFPAFLEFATKGDLGGRGKFEIGK